MTVIFSDLVGSTALRQASGAFRLADDRIKCTVGVLG
jgi:hypothetical protein